MAIAALTTTSLQLTPYIHLFYSSSRCISWAENNILSEMMPENMDPVCARWHGHVVKGWRSNHLGAGGAAAWCTAQVRKMTPHTHDVIISNP
jgi:hypothetical protein